MFMAVIDVFVFFCAVEEFVMGNIKAWRVSYAELFCNALVSIAPKGHRGAECGKANCSNFGK